MRNEKGFPSGVSARQVLILMVAGLILLISFALFSRLCPRFSVNLPGPVIISILIAALALAFFLGGFLLSFFRKSGLLQYETSVRILQKEWQELKGRLDALPDVLVMLDEDFEFILWNRKSESLFNRKEAEMLGCKLTDAPSFLRDLKGHVGRVHQNNVDVRLHAVPLMYRNANTMWDIQIFPVPSQGIGIRMVDVTGNYLDMRKQRSYNKLEVVERIARGLQLKFNNYLSGISGYAELMDQRDMPRESQGYRERISQIVSEFRQYVSFLGALTEQGRESELAIVDLVETVNAALRDLGESIPENLQIALDVKMPNSKILGSGTLLQQMFRRILRNILNRLKMDGQQREIRISFSSIVSSVPTVENAGKNQLKDHAIRIEFRKLGEEEEQGIEDDMFNLVLVDSQDDAGLDITYAWHVLRMHGGEMYMEADALVVEIPRVSESGVKLVAEKKKHPSESIGKKVLVVEDDREMRSILEDYLRHEGCQVNLVTSVSECQRRSQEEVFDVVILDLFLPDGNGTSCIKGFKEKNPDTLIIISTGYLEQGVIQEVHSQYPEVEFLLKPYPLMKLSQIIHDKSRHNVS